MSVSRIRAEYRRARRSLRLAQDELDGAVEDLADALGDLDTTQAVLLQATLDQLEELCGRLAQKVANLGLELDDAREERQQRRREAWQEVRAALARFGPSVLDVLRDVLEIQSAPRGDRLARAVQSLLDHAEIPLSEAEIEHVTALADQIVGALDG